MAFGFCKCSKSTFQNSLKPALNRPFFYPLYHNPLKSQLNLYSLGPHQIKERVKGLFGSLFWAIFWAF